MHPPVLRRTKIIATLGPASDSSEMLEALIREGVNIFRLNMAHAAHDWVRDVVRRVREAAGRTGCEPAILMDVKGPEIRTGDLEAPLMLRRGDLLDLITDPAQAPGEGVPSVRVNYPGLADDVETGCSILVDNGMIRLKVIGKSAGRLHTRVAVSGELTSRRHINLPGRKVNLPSVTDKDRDDMEVAVAEGIDMIALSFVRDRAAVDEVRDFLNQRGARAKIIAKIEDQEAVSNLDDIIRGCDGLMVARGDLGIEVPFEELPILQRRAVKACLTLGRPVIIATHMLESMITAPLPTRAEVTDVANAVFEQADCVMLSGETSIGRHPLECVRIMDKVARRIERSGGAGFARSLILASDKAKVLRSAVVMADALPGSALLIFTRQGFMAQVLAALRPRSAPVFAATNSRQVLRQLQLLWGVDPHFIPLDSEPETTIEKAIAHLMAAGRISKGQRIIVISDILSQDRLIDSIQLRTVR